MSVVAEARIALRAVPSPTAAIPVIAQIEAAARDGDGDAADLLATLYAAGAWVATDFGRALDYLKQAAAAGSPSAQAQFDLLAPATPVSLVSVPPRIAVCESPRVRLCETFVPAAWCDWLIAKAQGHLKAALTGYGEHAVQSIGRTNTTFELDVFDVDVIVSLVRARISAMLSMPVAAMELPQVLHYAVGQEFRLHADYMQRGGGFSERIATFLLYLNDDFEAGETWFPRAELKTKPRKGGALYFANVGAAGQPDPMSLHAGLAPTRGEKWLFSQWIHDGVPNGMAR